MIPLSIALQRIRGFADEGSFAELWGAASDSGVVTGYASVDGRPVYIFAQDPSSENGSVGILHAEKIAKLYKLAVRTSTPVVGLVDSTGIRVSEGAEAMKAFGKVLKAQTKAKGIIPQVFAVLGGCGGSMAISAGLADFVFTSDKAEIFVNPAAAREYTGPRAKIEEALAQSPANDALSCFKGKEEDVLAAVRDLYDLLPLSDLYSAPVYEGRDDMNRLTEGIDTVDCPNARMKMIADEGRFVIVKKIPETVVMGFARINGTVTACMAGKGTDLTAEAVMAMTRFTEFATDFGLPLLNLVNYGGFSAKEGQEALLPAAAAELAKATAMADIPKVSVIAGMAQGAVGTLFASSSFGMDIVFAWPDAEWSVMPDKLGAKILGVSESEYENIGGRQAFLNKGYIDSLIDPETTRQYVIGAFQMLADRAEL